MNKAAQQLGKMAAGKPKNFSAAELARRKKRLVEARKKRWPRTGAVAPAHLKSNVPLQRPLPKKETKL